MLRKLGIAALALVGGCLGLLAAVFAAAQTGPAKAWLAGHVAGALGGPGQQAEVERLEGFLPFDVRLGRLALRDDQGVWLEADDARLKVSPAALLRGEVHVEEVGAARVAVHRLPPPGPDEPSSGPFRLPDAPTLPEALPVTARLDRLHVDRIELAAPVLGEAAVFGLEGRGGTDEAGGTAEASLALRRLDEATASLNLAVKADLPARRLGISLKGDETGGLLAAATGRPEAGALRLSLEGDGPLDGWRGRLFAEAERLARAEATLGLAYAPARREASVEGSVALAPGALPADVAPLVGDRITLALRAGETGPGVFALERLALEAGALGLTGRATADTNADRLDGVVRLDVPALAPLGGLAGVPLAGRVGLTLDASGRISEPALRLGMEGADIAVAERVSLARLGGGYDVVLLRDAAGAVGGARVAGSVTTEGLAVEGRPVGEGGRAALEVRAEAPAAGQQIRVERLALASGVANVAVAGTVERATLAGRLRLDGGVPDLALIAELLPPETAQGLPPLQGALALDGEATLSGAQAERVEARLGLTAERLAGLPPGAQDLLGPAPRLEARVTVEQRKAVKVETIRLDGAAVSLVGDPALGPNRELGGGLTLELPDLARLEPALGQPVGGRVVAKASFAGTLQAPAITLDATGDALRFGDQLVDRAVLVGKASGPVDSLAGDARLTATRGGQDLALAADYALAGRKLRLPRLELTGPQTKLAGDVEVDLDSTLATGRLAGGVANLAALSAWHGQADLAGAVDLQASLAVRDGRQDAELKAEARGIAGPFGNVGQATVTAAGRDVRGQAASVDAQARVAGFGQPGLELREALLTAKGPLGGVGLTLSAAGAQADRPFDLRAQADVAALGEAKSLGLRSFTGTFAGQRVELAAPARLSLDQGVLDLDRLDLRAGPARVQASLRYGAGSARGEARLAALPLNVLESFGAPPLQGSAQGRVTLAGTPSAPEVALDLAVRELRPGGADRSVPAATLNLGGKASGGRAQARLAVAGLGGEPLTVEISLPATFSLEPAALDVPRDAALTGRIVGPVDLARVAALAALDRQRVAGVLQSDLRLGGTLAEPRLDGRLAMAGGRADDLTTGASFRNVAFAARASGRRLDLSDLSAVDRHGGRLAARGGVVLDDALRPSFDLALTLARARLLDGDLGTASVSGEATLKGGAEDAAVYGRFRIDQADLRIPDGSAVGVPELDVVEKGSARAAAAGVEPAAGPDAAGYPVRLDVAVDAPSRLFVRGRGLESEWGGAVTVKGEAADPQLGGQIRVRRGFLDLLNRRFTVREGVVAFAGGSPVPLLNLEAVARTEEVQAVVTLRGPANDPKISLESEPELPQDEILARVLFGRSVDKITPVQGLRLAAAVNQLRGGGGVGGVLDSVRDAAGLDELDLGAGATAGESSARVGKYVSDRVFLELQRGVQAGSGKARVEVELTPNLSVGTEVTERSQTGVDLEWRYDY